MDNLSPEKRSKIMRAIKSKNTKSEVLLAKALWHRGHRYRKHVKSIFGTPDIAFSKYKIAIFVDSEFFHGKDWDLLKARLNSNKEFWHTKIERNMEKDRKVNETLSAKGWTILRFWSDQVQKNLSTVIATIEMHLIAQKEGVPIILYPQSETPFNVAAEPEI
jgi:DNA mismatch endonuclease (patch repair protein)